ncbi:hypothetical protein QUF54_06925 [Candidatus Marithioploca araucensis]|uniref:Uncharacterized protein n=1 Tax=Candidatus Marithioploca araucensis TaxID=70273 RepID=A0ABT7VU45_9GAMM|nr:hypothetical protein [Candidatus Marithioploca araucensis]
MHQKNVAHPTWLFKLAVIRGASEEMSIFAWRTHATLAVWLAT